MVISHILQAVQVGILLGLHRYVLFLHQINAVRIILKVHDQMIGLHSSHVITMIIKLVLKLMVKECLVVSHAWLESRVKAKSQVKEY